MTDPAIPADLPLTRKEREEIEERLEALSKETVTAADVRRIVEEVLAERVEKAKTAAPAAPPSHDEEDW